MDDRLQAKISAAQQTYLRNAGRLAKMAALEGWRDAPELGDVFEWLMGVTIELSPTMGRTGRGADGYANGPRQRIRLNPTVVATTSDEDLEDLILHELGHLFTWRFKGTIKHNREWQLVGFVVGYVPVGSTNEQRRKSYAKQMLLYRMAAAAGMAHPSLGY